MAVQIFGYPKVFSWLLLFSTLESCFAVDKLPPKLPYQKSSSLYKADPFDATESARDERLHIFTVDYEYVQIPYEVTIWILLASLAKIGFHLYHRLPHFVPESCLYITMGALVGGIIFGTHHKSPPVMTTSIYFLYLLPPIILEQGYFMPTRPFFENFGSILWWSAMGSLINAFGIGISLYGICQITAFGLKDVNLLNSLLFGSIISAVDPTAVLAVFEEMSVNEQLYMMIFGESLLNDGITVVLYNIFIEFTQMHKYEEIEPSDILAGFARFFVVSLGGLLFGIAFGFVAAFITRFTQNISAIEPLLVFMFSYLSYLSAETLYISGILAITACAVTMKKYVEANVSQNSYTTIKYFMKMLSSVSETLIFVFMGVSTIGRNHEWNWAFIGFTLVFCMLWRALSDPYPTLFSWLMGLCCIAVGLPGVMCHFWFGLRTSQGFAGQDNGAGVFLLFSICNKFRTYKFTLKDQFIVIYSGLRGASNFSLAFLLPTTLFPRKKMFITSTIVMIYFTVFIQGISIKALVKHLDVKKTNKKESINEEIHVRLMDHLKAGIEDICGHWSHYQLRDKFKKFDNKFLKKVLLRKHQPKSSLVSLYKKLEIKQVIGMVESGATTPGSSKSSLRYWNQRTQRLSPKGVESMQNMLANNLYQVRKRTLSYNRYNLATDSREKQSREILIRHQHNLQQKAKQSHSLPWGGQTAMKNQRYFSLPFGNSQPIRRTTRINEDNLTGNGSSDTMSVFMIHHSETGPESLQRKQREQEFLPMEQLFPQTKLTSLTRQKSRTQEQDKQAAIQKLLLPPKSQLNAVLETDTQELESEDEVNRDLWPAATAIIWPAETKGKKPAHRSKRHFTPPKK